MDADLKRFLEEMRQENGAAHEETRRHSENVAGDMRRHSEVVADDMRRHSEVVAAETRRYFDLTAERLEHKIGLLSEAVMRVDETIDRETIALREEMRQGFAQTHAIIQFSHGELDRRLRALE